jgi:histone demethylase JARID1
MVEKEIEIRNRVRSGPSPPIEVVREEDLPTEDDYQCSTCKTFSYLSQITCSCTSAVSCIEHAAQLCGCPSDKQTLRLRFSDSNLIILQDNIDEKAAVPTAWKSRLQKILKDSEAPPLKSLRALVSEAERSSYQLPEFPPLKAYVDRANELVAEASLFLARKSTGRKTGGGRSRKSTAASADVEMEDDEESTKPTRTIEAVVNLLQGVDQLGFDASEIVDLRAVLESAQDFRSRATSVLSLPDAEQDLPSLEALHVTGASLKLEIPELAPLSLIIRRLSLLRELDEVEERDLEIKDVEAYLETAKEVGIPAEHEFVVDLEKKKLAGCAWRGETRQTFTAGSTDLATLERLLKRADEVPVERELFVQLKQLRAKAVDWDKTAKALIKSAMTQPQLEDDAKPSTIADVRRLLKRVDTKSVCTVVIPEVEVLREEVAWHEAWSRELYAAFPDVPKVKLLSHLQAMQDNIVARTHPDDDMPAPIEADTEPAAAESKDDAESDGEGEKEGEGEEQEQAPRALLPFSCVCRGPEVLPMLTCKKCGATYVDSFHFLVLLHASRMLTAFLFAFQLPWRLRRRLSAIGQGV